MKYYCICIAMLCLSYLCACKTDPLAKFPAFKFRLSDSTTIVDSKDIPTDKPIVFISFEADCTGCQQITDSLLQNINVVKNVRFYFLTMENFSKVKLWKNHYHFERYPNITIGQDYQRIAYYHFKVRGTPYIALYNTKKDLAGIYDGKPNVTELIASINQLH
jgi:hypothetical protein